MSNLDEKIACPRLHIKTHLQQTNPYLCSKFTFGTWVRVNGALNLRWKDFSALTEVKLDALRPVVAELKKQDAKKLKCTERVQFISLITYKLLFSRRLRHLFQNFHLFSRISYVPLVVAH